MPVRFLSPAHYQSYGQYNGNPNNDQLSRHFYLTDFDHTQIRNRRRKSNRMGFALQLVTVRFLGTYLKDITAIPEEVRIYLADQLQVKLNDDELLAYNQSQAFWSHQSISIRFTAIAHFMMFCHLINFYAGYIPVSVSVPNAPPCSLIYLRHG